MSLFTIDNMTFDVNILSLTRSFAVTDTDSSGRTQDGTMHRDIIGTYYNYTLEIEPFDTAESRADYDTLYELLSAPVSDRSIMVPYGQGTLTFDAYVTSGEDILRSRSGRNKWSGLTINFIAMSPQREG